MVGFISIQDPVAGPTATGQVRFELRHGSSDTQAPTLVLIGGMTQTVSSWGGHLRELASDRDVLTYETRGQGTTDLNLSDCGFAQHVDDFAAMLAALGIAPPVDLCGFSFGGRVALAIAALRPELVRRLICSGLAVDRGIVGRLIVQGWWATLETGNLDALARVTLPDILGPTYLEKHAHLIEGMVRAAVERNRYAGVRALLAATVDAAAAGPQSPCNVQRLAEQISAPTLCIGGSLDRLAPPAEVAALAALLRGGHRILDGVGHTVAIEAPQPWRDEVQAFLRLAHPDP